MAHYFITCIGLKVNLFIQIMEQMTTKDMMATLKDFLWHCEFEKKLDRKTIKAYETDLKQFISIVGNEHSIKDITKLEIKQYLQSISYLRHKTIKRKLASLRSMLNHIEHEDESYINPMRKMHIHMREPLRLPTVLNMEECRKIIDAVHRNMTNKSSYSALASIRDVAVVEMLLATGMRVSELCNLRNGDVDLSQGEITIIGKGNKERIVYVCQPETLSALTRWMQVKASQSPELPFFTNRLNRGLSPQSVRHLIRHLAVQASLSKHITRHTFRHTLATLLLEEDVDIRYIQSILGHSSISTTQIYTHVNLSKQKQICQMKHPRRRL